jgi:hypothetical protein
MMPGGNRRLAPSPSLPGVWRLPSRDASDLAYSPPVFMLEATREGPSKVPGSGGVAFRSECRAPVGWLATIPSLWQDTGRVIDNDEPGGVPWQRFSLFTAPV